MGGIEIELLKEMSKRLNFKVNLKRFETSTGDPYVELVELVIIIAIIIIIIFNYPEINQNMLFHKKQKQKNHKYTLQAKQINRQSDSMNKLHGF